MTTLDRVESESWPHLVPAARLPVSAWLDANRFVGRGYPSPFPGPWRTDRTPYLRQPMDDFTDPEVETLVLLFSSQIGKTEALLGTLLYSYKVDPGPGMFVLPTLDLAEAMSSERLASALKACPALRVADQKSRTTDDAVRHKRINGFTLAMAGANSTAGLSSRPVRRVWCDEIDRWPSTTPEGDPLALVRQRTAAYRRRMTVLTSTPTIKGASRIEEEYAKSDQRELHLQCLACEELFIPKWKDVRWTKGDPESARLVCPVCGFEAKDEQRHEMVKKARWIATAPFRGVRGYRTWAIVSPWTRLSEMVEAFLKAKPFPDKLQAWINLTLGESWEQPSEKRVESADLLERREHYEVVPSRAKVLTAAVDTQDDRLEFLAMGWGVGEEAWVLHRETLWGDPDKPEVWAEFDRLRLKTWAREDGGFSRIQCTLVDALGHRTNAVYAAVVRRQAQRVFASIGKDGGDGTKALVSPLKVLRTEQGNVMRYIVDASQAKALLYSRLTQQAREGPGAVHFPMTVGDAFFTELTAEHLLTERNKWGVASQKWAMRPGRTRNESLDLFGMAMAALHVICSTPERFAEFARLIEFAPAERGRTKVPRTQGFTP